MQFLESVRMFGRKVSYLRDLEPDEIEAMKDKTAIPVYHKRCRNVIVRFKWKVW